MTVSDLIRHAMDETWIFRVTGATFTVGEHSVPLNGRSNLRVHVTIPGDDEVHSVNVGVFSSWKKTLESARWGIRQLSDELGTMFVCKEVT